MIDVMTKLKEIADSGYNNEDIQRGINAAEKHQVQETFTEDEVRALCHSKDHDCATIVEHPVWGLGKPMYESHAVPTDDGNVEWYDVEFKHGIEREVPASDMKIVTSESHGGNGKKKKKMMASKKVADEKAIEEDAVEEVHEEVEEDYDDLSDILKLAGQSGVIGMKSPATLVVENVEVQEEEIEEEHVEAVEEDDIAEETVDEDDEKEEDEEQDT